MFQQNLFRADLHCHSTFSDGSLTPKEIVALAKSLHLSGLSITDHDSIYAYPEALQYASEENILMITGVEFSASHKGKSVHVLGYGFDHTHASILNLCKKHTLRRTERNELILKKLAQDGIIIEEKELLYAQVLGRPHIAKALVEKGYADSVEEAFKKYLGDNKPYFVTDPNPISVEETVDVIHQAHGYAVLAHPHLANDYNLVQELLTLPFDGLECYYAKFPLSEHKRWLKLAEKKNLLITGGSDFHGDAKPFNSLGSSWIDENHFHKLTRSL